MEAFIDVAHYKPFGEKQKSDHQRSKPRQPVLGMGAMCGAVPPKDGMNLSRPSRYATEDGMNFTGIDFPTPV